MKKFLRGILTIWIVVLLIVLGLVLSIKSILINTADGIIKEEITNNVVDVVENNLQEEISEETIKEIENTIENNEEIKKLLDTNFDKVIDILSDENSLEKIDVKEDLNSIIETGEKVLNEYGITITEEEKQQIFSVASSDEVNNLVNNTIIDIKQDLNSDTKLILDTYKFLNSSTFKLILVALIVVSLLFIALLKKSYYKWLSNFGIATIITGIIIGILLPLLVSSLLETIMENNSLVISTDFLKNYGIALIILGVISNIINIVISKIVENNNKNKEISTENNK